MTTTADEKSSKGGPDIRQLADRDLAKANFPGEAKVDFRIALDEKVHKEIQKHAKENKQVEICGVLVGKWGKDEKGPFVAISASIRGEAATNKFAEVTFTHDTWSKINAEMDKSYAGYNIVGWYHTHPDFGIFLSDRDRFIHENFFSEPGQVAYVVDPIRDIEGFFIWQGGKPVPAPYYWAGDKIKMAPAEKDPRSMKREKRAVDESDRESAPPADGGPLTWITLLLGGLCLFMLGMMVSDFRSGMDRQRMLETTEKFGAIQLLQRMMLSQKLANASVEFREAAAVIDQLSRNSSPLDENQKQLVAREVNKMITASNEVDQLQREFGVTNGEIAALNALATQTQTVMDNAKAAATQSTTTSPLAVSPAPTMPQLTPGPATTQPTTAPSK